MAYEFDGFGVTAAYSNSKRTNDQQDRDGNGDRAESWAVGAKYDANNVYLAAVYAETRNMSIVENTVTDTVEMANKTQNLEVVAQYQFDFGLRPAISYVQSKGKQLRRSGGCRYYLPVLISRPLCFMPQKQDFGPVFLSLLEKMCVFQKQAGFLALTVGIL